MSAICSRCRDSITAKVGMTYTAVEWTNYCRNKRRLLTGRVCAKCDLIPVPSLWQRFVGFFAPKTPTTAPLTVTRK